MPLKNPNSHRLPQGGATYVISEDMNNGSEILLISQPKALHSISNLGWKSVFKKRAKESPKMVKPSGERVGQRA